MPAPPADRCADRPRPTAGGGANAPPSPSPDWRDPPLSAFPQAASRTLRYRETTRTRRGMWTQPFHGREGSRSNRPQLAFDRHLGNRWRYPKPSWLPPCLFARNRAGSRLGPAWSARAKILDLLWWLAATDPWPLRHQTHAISRFQERRTLPRRD